MNSGTPSILHVIDTTGPGGAETVFIQLAAATKRENMAALAVIRGHGWVEEQLKKNDIGYVMLACKGSFNFRYLFNLIRVVREHRVELIQSHLLGSNVYCSLAGLVTRTPVIATFHGHVDISPNERLRWLKFTMIALGCRRVIAVTKTLHRAIMAMGSGWLAQKAEVIPNGIDVSELTSIAIEPLPNPRQKLLVIGCLGNIRKAKNYFLAVDFIGELIKNGYHVRLKIAGDDSHPLAEELRRYIRSRNIDQHIELQGFVDDITGFLREIDLFLMTSTSEGHPLALTQALAAGKPVLSTPSGVEEIVTPGRHAWVAEDHSVEALLVAFQAIFADNSTMEVRAAGRELAIENFSVASMVTSYFSIYDRYLA